MFCLRGETSNRGFQKKEPHHEGLSVRNILNDHLYAWAKYSWVVIRWAAEVVGQCAAAVRGWAQSLLVVGPQLGLKYPRPQLGWQWQTILEKIP